MPHVKPLSPETLKHWGLLASPFSSCNSLDVPAASEEFYFRSGPHAALWSWFENSIRNRTPLNVIHAPHGSGIHTFFRQIIASGGVGNQAIDASATQWTTRSVAPLAARMPPNFSLGIRPVWLLDAVDARQVKSISHWLSSQTNEIASLSIFIRIADDAKLGIAQNSIGRIRVASMSVRSKIQCIEQSMRHCGGTRTILTGTAARLLASRCSGTVDIAANVHASLTEGARQDLTRITEREVHARDTSTGKQRAA